MIGVIYESRPNVTAGCGFAVPESRECRHFEGRAPTVSIRPGPFTAAWLDGLKSAGLPEAAIQLVPITDRAAVGEMLKGLNGRIDVIVPRGGRGLVERVQSDARVPVFAHLEGTGPCLCRQIGQS